MTELNFPEPLTRSLSEDADDRVDPAASGMADAYADNLMTELFDDVDRLLSDEPGAIALVDPRLALADEDGAVNGIEPASLMSLSGALDLPRFQETPTVSEAHSAKSKRGWGWLKRPFNQLVMGATCMSALFTVGLWWFSSQQQTPNSQPATQPIASPAELQAEADGQFLEYLRRSLDVIDAQSEAKPAAANGGVATSLPHVSVSGMPAGTLPPLPGTAAASPATPNVIERIYVPVYQPPQTAVTTAPNFGTGAVAPSPAATAATPPPNVSPALTHVLVGVLELGDRSAALFEINGVPQRIYVGQNIAASGWTLVSVANQEAVIRRNGDVRSVFVGQQF